MGNEQLIVTIGAKDSASTVIRKVNQELKYLDKEYKLTEKGSKNFDKSMDGLQAKLSMLERKYETNNIKLQAYKKQLDTAREGISKKEAELEKLTNAEGDNSIAIEKAEKQLSRYKDQMVNATRNINLTELEIKNLNDEINNTSKSINSFKIDQFKAKMDEMALKMESNGEKIKEFGEGTSKLGGTLMKLSAPVVGLGVASTKAAIDFETAFAGVVKTVDGTTEQFAALEEGIKDMSTQMPQSAVKIAAVAEAAGQLGIKTDSILGFTKTMVMLGDSTNMSSDEAATALARLANITQMPQDKFENLGSTIVALGNNMATTESEITEMGLRLAGAGSQVGMSEAKIMSFAAALSSVGIEAEAGGSAFSKVMVNMQLAVERGGESLNQFAKVSGMSSEQFKKAFEEDAASAIIAFITGLQNVNDEGVSAISMLDDMGISEVRMRDALLRAAGAGDVFSNAIQLGSDAWEENVALTNEAGKRYETTASKIEILKNKATKLGIELGEELLPYVVDIMEELSNLVNWFSSLDKSTQQTIIKTGLLTFALGGALKVVGNFTSGIGSIVKVTGKTAEGIGNIAKKVSDFSNDGVKATKSIDGLSKGMNLLNPVTLGVGAGITAVAGAMMVVKTNNELMKRGISYTTDEMSTLEKVVAKFNGTSFKSRKELEESGVIYKEFNKNISPEFQEKVKENTKAINDFAIKLHEINFDGVISEEESQSFVNEVNNACTNAINAIKARQEESNKAMQDMFISDGVISESERKVIEFMNKSSETQITEVNKLKEEILAIEQKALTEKRILTDGEISIIQEKNARIRQIELENLAKSEEEILYSTNEFRERIKNIDLEGAKEIVAEKSKIRDDEAAKISAGYDTEIQLMKNKLEEAKEAVANGEAGVTRETVKALEEQIGIAETRKEELLKKNNQLYDGYLAIINEKNPTVMQSINKFNGEELSKADHKKQKILETLKEQYEGLDKITESGNYLLLDKTNNSLMSVAVTVDEKTGEITGIYDRFSGNVGAYTSEIGEDVKNMGIKHDVTNEQIKAALNDMENAVIDTSGNIVDANGNIIWALDDFKMQTDETREGVLNLNGTPVNIKADTSGAISNIEEVNNAVDNIPGSKEVTILTIFEAIGDGIKSLFGFAEGTNYAPVGPAFVSEEGRELIEKNGSFILTGNSGPQLYNFSGGEKVYTNAETEKILAGLNSGYFNANSYKSQSLTRNSNVINNYSSSVNNMNNTDIASIVRSLASEITSTLIEGLKQVRVQGGNVCLETGQIIGKVSNEFAMSGKRVR